jgi:hypothetical protein
VYILFGIISGGGGLGYTPAGKGKKPDPVDPVLHSTWNAMSPAKRDLLLGLAIDEVAGLIADSRARGDFQKSARKLINSSTATITRVERAPAAGAAGKATTSRPLQRFER